MIKYSFKNYGRFGHFGITNSRKKNRVFEKAEGYHVNLLLKPESLKLHFYHVRTLHERSIIFLVVQGMFNRIHFDLPPNFLD